MSPRQPRNITISVSSSLTMPPLTVTMMRDNKKLWVS